LKSKLNENLSNRRVEYLSYYLAALGPLAGNAVLVLQGSIAANFSVNPETVLLAMFVFMVPFATLQLLTGAISDSRGRVPVISIGLLVFASGMMFSAFSQSLEMFLLANFLQGIGYSFVNPVLVALITDVSNLSDYSKKMGFLGAILTLSVGVGPAIAGYLVIFGWRFFYIVFSILSFFGLVAINLVRGPGIGKQDESVRIIARGLSEELRKPSVLLMMGSALLIALAYVGIRVWTSTGLTGAVSEDVIGNLLLLVSVTGTIAGLLLSRIINRVGLLVTILLGLTSLIISTILMLLPGDITLPTSMVFVGIAFLFTGWAGGTLFPIVNIYGQTISPQRRGVLAGAVTSFYFIGQAAVTILYQPIYLIGMSAIYSTILLVSIALALLLLTLNRMTNVTTSE
jgi:DHA1 family 2-module integral membrane pump EmrD-like MFS transporter